MTTDDRWTQLKETARKRLCPVDKPTFIESFIEYECEPSFEPIFNLQIIWTDKGVRWRRAEWDNHADWNKFYESDGKTKVILSEHQPTLTIMNGVAPFDVLTEIISHVQTLKISPRIDRLKMFTLDGSLDKISIGVDDLRTTYIWHTLPDEWKELRQLADMVIELYKKLQST